MSLSLFRSDAGVVQKMSDQVLNSKAKTRAGTRFVTAGLSTAIAVTPESLDTSGFVTAAKNSIFTVTAGKP